MFFVEFLFFEMGLYLTLILQVKVVKQPLHPQTTYLIRLKASHCHTHDTSAQQHAPLTKSMFSNSSSYPLVVIWRPCSGSFLLLTSTSQVVKQALFIL